MLNNHFDVFNAKQYRLECCTRGRHVSGRIEIISVEEFSKIRGVRMNRVDSGLPCFLDVNVACIWLGMVGSTIRRSRKGNCKSLANCCFKICVV